MQVRKTKTHRDRVRDKQTQTKIYIYICVETDRQREWGGGTEGQTDRQRLQREEERDRQRERETETETDRDREENHISLANIIFDYKLKQFGVNQRVIQKQRGGGGLFFMQHLSTSCSPPYPLLQVQTDDVLTLAQAAIPECQTYNEHFRELTFSPRCIPVDTTPMVKYHNNHFHLSEHSENEL